MKTLSRNRVIVFGLILFVFAAGKDFMAQTLPAETPQEFLQRVRNGECFVWGSEMGFKVLLSDVYRMVFRYYGDAHADVQQFAPLVDVRAGGIATGTLVAAVAARGWRATPIVGTLQLLRDALESRQPIIVLNGSTLDEV